LLQFLVNINAECALITKLMTFTAALYPGEW